MGDVNNVVPVKEENDIKSKLPSESTPSRKNVKEERARKKDDRNVEQVLKALNSLDTPEEKLAAMCKKYADTVDENRKLQLSLKQTEKRLIMLQREKEQLQTEHSKAVLTRSRLESLCRELQRQNKAVKDESLLKIREEEEKRREVSARFQSTLADVTALMKQNTDKNSKLREDNLEMTEKFKSICEQYELREQQVDKISKQLQLEARLADAKMAQVKMEMAAEKEILLQEKQQLLMEVVECQAKIKDLQATETSLRNQISLYTNKYDEFQSTLSRSNDVFEGFKSEMEKMSKKICKLEKETSSWKQRWEKSHQALLEMAADKQQRDGELQLATRQLVQLTKLCRTLQTERTSLLAQLKARSSGAVENIKTIQEDNSVDVTEQNLDSMLSQAEEQAGVQQTETSQASATSQQPSEPAVTTETSQQTESSLASEINRQPFQPSFTTETSQQQMLQAESSLGVIQQPVLQTEALEASEMVQGQVLESQISQPVAQTDQLSHPMIPSVVSQQPAVPCEVPTAPAEVEPSQAVPAPVGKPEPTQEVHDRGAGDFVKVETSVTVESSWEAIPSQTDLIANCANPAVVSVSQESRSSPQSSHNKKSKEDDVPA